MQVSGKDEFGLTLIKWNFTWKQSLVFCIKGNYKAFETELKRLEGQILH